MKRPDLCPYRRIFLTWTAMLIVIAGLPDIALAHRVTVFAWVDGNTVVTQSRFSGGKAVQNGDITVYDDQGHQLLTGKTDTAGEFSFKLPAQTGVRIVLNAGMGHGNEWTLAPDEMGGRPPENDNPAAVRSRPEPPISPAPVAAGLTRKEIQEIVDRSLDNRLKPLMIILSELRDDSPSISDILGGIGYIIGLVGLAAYIRNRKKR